MSWTIKKVNKNPMQFSVVIENKTPGATPTTDFREADKLARSAIGSPRLIAKSYGSFSGTPERIYTSQAY